MPIEFDENVVQYVWDKKAKVVLGQDPNVVRKDYVGAWIKRKEYGQQSEYGWSIDLILPVNLGGDERNLKNLYVCHWKNYDARDHAYPNWTSVYTASEESPAKAGFFKNIKSVKKHSAIKKSTHATGSNPDRFSQRQGSARHGESYGASSTGGTKNTSSSAKNTSSSAHKTATSEARKNVSTSNASSKVFKSTSNVRVNKILQEKRKAAMRAEAAAAAAARAAERAAEEASQLQQRAERIEQMRIEREKRVQEARNKARLKKLKQQEAKRKKKVELLNAAKRAQRLEEQNRKLQEKLLKQEYELKLKKLKRKK